MEIKASYQPTYKEVLEALGAVSEIEYNELLEKIKRLEEQKRKVIALIKDGRFVEALQELEDK